jgi:hemerythrin-like domain-containing protein
MAIETHATLTDLLVREHDLIQRALKVLARLCSSLRHGGPPEPEAAATLISFLTEFADEEHHAKEEDVLFPWMERNGVPRDSGPIGVMLQEHVEGREHIEGLRKASEGLVANPNDGRARSFFVLHGEGYAMLLWAHIWKENNILFQLGESLAGGTAPLLAEVAQSEESWIINEQRVVALEERARGWPPEAIQWPQGCHGGQSPPVSDIHS